jgi:hypothetical protein
MLRGERIDTHAAHRIDDAPIGIGMRMVRMVLTGVMRVIVSCVIVSAAATFPAVCIPNHDRSP